VFCNELFWRDFYRYWSLKNGNTIFTAYGIYHRDYLNWGNDEELLSKWLTGKTGMPIIDALINEMNYSGFNSNRGRMIAASYLSNDLKLDWRYGANHFEEKLLDHDV